MVYKVICSRCDTHIGDSHEEPNVAVCMDCYHRNKESKSKPTLRLVVDNTK